MAFVNGFGDLRDEPRYRNTSSAQDEPNTSAFDSPLSPIRTYSNRHSLQPPSNNDPRAAMHRRFTTNALPTLSPIGQQRRQAAETQDPSSMAYHRVQLLEKKKLEYEYLKEKRRKFEAQMELIDAQARQDEDEMQRLASELGRLSSSGHQSEPTTPPEYRDAGYPSTMPRPNSNRYSTTSLTSPPGLSNRGSRTGSQLTSPPSDTSRPYGAMPSHSLANSRRNSAKDPDLLSSLSNAGSRSAIALNRNSMPVTTLDVRGRSDLSDYEDVLGNLDRSFFLEDDEPKPNKRQTLPATTPDYKSYLHVDAGDDKFPILVRRDGDGSMQLSSASGMDSSQPQSPSPEHSQMSNGWPSNKRSSHRYSLNGATSSGLGDGYASPHTLSGTQTPTKNNTNRHSIENGFSSANSKRLGMIGSPSNGASLGPPKLLSSYSMNDIPTMKSSNSSAPTQAGSVNTHAEQHFHNHNVNMGRIPPGKAGSRQSQDYSSLSATSNRQSQDYSGLSVAIEEDNATKQALSHLQGNATSFGPSSAASTVSAASQSAHSGTSAFTSPATQYSNPSMYNNYGINLLNMNMNQMQLNGTNGWGNAATMYQTPQFAGYNQYQQFNPGSNSQTRIMQQQQRRQVNTGDDNARFNNVRLEDLQGEIYGLCKDQHGCRYLQKQLDDGDSEHLRLIFEETEPHVIDLMIDPFGNYLCQKLLEQANEEQCTVLIRNASNDMVKIALNQHGTRALQKMIEYISTPKQVALITEALRNQVVQLIQDLNGNHVIQKLLTNFNAKDLDFIFNAVAQHCVTVGTHRHGCCVLQRCIDHAVGSQKADLVAAITAQANDLVQDPFGNYVVQYVLDQNEPAFSEPLCMSFRGHVPAMSRQKFSSNVIEKCIRVSEPGTKRFLIEELMQPGEVDRLIRDSFANYVVQTAIDFADPETKVKLVETIRPLLPQIRNTPYGRRIQLKIQENDNKMSPAPAPTMGGFDTSSPPQMQMMPQPANYGGYMSAGPPGFVPSMGGDVNRGYGAQPQYGFQAAMGNAFAGNPPLFGSIRSRQSMLGGHF